MLSDFFHVPLDQPAGAGGSHPRPASVNECYSSIALCGSEKQQITFRLLGRGPGAQSPTYNGDSIQAGKGRTAGHGVPGTATRIWQG